MVLCTQYSAMSSSLSYPALIFIYGACSSFSHLVGLTKWETSAQDLNHVGDSLRHGRSYIMTAITPMMEGTPVVIPNLLTLTPLRFHRL